MTFIAAISSIQLALLLAGFVPPCLPTRAARPPSGPLWLHETKHDGFRIIARTDGQRVRNPRYVTIL
jgi:ATP-dependent DNA ligase